MKSVLDDFVLALNKGWTPIGTTNVRTAFTHICNGSAKFLDLDDYQAHDLDKWMELPIREGETVVHTAHATIRVPHILILRYAKTPTRSVMAYNNKNVFRRDHHKCQYCGAKPNPRELTIDHVLPRSKGGLTSWENCVASCARCNGRKDKHTLAECGMELMIRPEMKMLHPNDPHKWRKPYVPSWSPIFNVAPSKFKDTWAGFVGQKHLQEALAGATAEE